MKYKIIYADPPWSYYNDSSALPNCTTVKGMRRPPYPVLASKEIGELPIGQLAAENCLLFIWTTDYHLLKCLGVIKSWGFEYKTVGFVWLKKNLNGSNVTFTGPYTMKSGIELCLLATKGEKAHSLVINQNVRAFLEYPRSHHSAKPDIIRDRIVSLVGNVPRLELFARKTTKGWDVFGNEVNESIKL